MHYKYEWIIYLSILFFFLSIRNRNVLHPLGINAYRLLNLNIRSIHSIVSDPFEPVKDTSIRNSNSKCQLELINERCFRGIECLVKLSFMGTSCRKTPETITKNNWQAITNIFSIEEKNNMHI